MYLDSSVYRLQMIHFTIWPLQRISNMYQRPKPGDCTFLQRATQSCAALWVAEVWLNSYAVYCRVIQQWAYAVLETTVDIWGSSWCISSSTTGENLWRVETFLVGLHKSCVSCVYYVRIDRPVFGFYEVPCAGERVCLYARTLSAYAYFFSVFSKKMAAKN